MFDKMKQLYEMQKQARSMQKSVEAMKVEKSAEGGKITVVMNGAMKVESLSIDESLLSPANKSSLEKSLTRLLSDAAEEAGKLASQEAMAMMKNLNIKLPGM
jgi:DNA-binding YbaB/EbfC family protein